MRTEIVLVEWGACSLSRFYSAFAHRLLGHLQHSCHPKLHQVMQKRDGLKTMWNSSHIRGYSHQDKHPGYITNRLQTKSGICISFCAPPFKISSTFILSTLSVGAPTYTTNSRLIHITQDKPTHRSLGWSLPRCSPLLLCSNSTCERAQTAPLICFLWNIWKTHTGRHISLSLNSTLIPCVSAITTK